MKQWLKYLCYTINWLVSNIYQGMVLEYKIPPNLKCVKILKYFYDMAMFFHIPL